MHEQQHQAAGLDDPYGLPQFYIADGGARIERPVYLLEGDCFLGRPGGPPSYWEAGTELETDVIPNDNMRPLNRAAAIKYNEWKQSLPPEASACTPDELLEAGNILMRSRKPDDPEIPFEIWRASVYQLAMELKIRRDGRLPPSMPKSQQFVTPANGRPPPPMSAGDFKDMTHRDPNATGMQAHPQLAAKRVKRQAAPPMATEPKPPAGDAVGM
jgi:hypothetical protein